MMLLLISFLVDCTWIILWGNFWRDKTYFPKGYWENTIHSVVLGFSALNILLKVKLIVILY